MRIANLQLKNTHVNNIMRNNQGAVAAQKQMLTGKKFQDSSEDPIAAITSLYSRIRINQLDRYEENVELADTQIKVAHDKLTSANNLVRRIRELAVRGANGPLPKSDRINIAFEVEELLQELVSIANSQFEDSYLFSGSHERNEPFRTTTSFNPELGKTLIDQTFYTGDNRPKTLLVGDKSSIEILNNGAEIFWADQQTLISQADARNFITPVDSTLRIDGYDAIIQAGDNLDVIIEKINESVPTVNAFAQELPTGERTLAIEGNFPHQLALEDVEGSTLFRQLGFLKTGGPGSTPYENLRADVIADNGSIFDRVILFRNALINNETRDLGGIHLGGISRSLDNLVSSQSKLSATAERLQGTRVDLSVEKQHVVERRSQVEDADIAEAIINYNEFNYLHRISLQTASNLLSPTLLDFL